ncbi:MAG: hypothetical protein MRY63_12380 [Neomegalonema sp.]|nr:hypothetical protein [Neomegalonema sp.]
MRSIVFVTVLTCAFGLGASAALAGPWTEYSAKNTHPDTFPVLRECKTVDMFERKRIRAAKKVPEQWRAFLGHWKSGAWRGALCQELVISEIHDDGSVVLYDLQGRYDAWGRSPSAFRREGRFLDDNRLQVEIGGPALLTFWIEDGLMYGVYDWGQGTMRIRLAQE